MFWMTGYAAMGAAIGLAIGLILSFWYPIFWVPIISTLAGAAIFPFSIYVWYLEDR